MVMQACTIQNNAGIDWKAVEDAARKVIKSVRSNGVLTHLGNELIVVRRAAVRLLRSKLRGWFGTSPRKELLDLAHDWFVEDFITGLSGYDVDRPLQPFMGRMLWRRFTRHARRLDRDDRHQARVQAFSTLVRGAEIDPSAALAAEEVREAVKLALFNMVPADRAMLTLWSSKMSTREIVELLQMDDVRWFRLTWKARKSFVTEFRKIWLECGFPLDAMPALSRRAKVSRSRVKS
ncbi:MAG: hypothetical protein H7144_10085 [Burkholderiales bacterium]|nr:hypothetical protein [Phycisphaerae bacterium]